ncbi:chromate efflux transporter [Pseudogemmobacter sonorensis]|uniref:chromate efflux transporter n=1 Tax=Pseudogemmobacter sonorensis TaxID=2989681 RepID=UPI0036864E5B
MDPAAAPSPVPPSSTGLAPPPSLADLARVFARIGILSFGGPAAQIALLHRVARDERNWVDEGEYLRALSFCMLLPGPEAMQLATWIGWRLRGTPGGLIAGGLFVLPGALVVLALSGLYAGFGGVAPVAALFVGVQAAVIAIVAQALLRLSRRVLVTGWARGVALAAFVGLFALNLPFPAILIAAALTGALATAGPVAPSPGRVQGRAPGGMFPRAVALWLAVWLLPLAALFGLAAAFPAVPGLERLAEIGAFFSRLAALSFGGAYALLAWMSQELVAARGWLTAAQMMDGLALAETTPGPLILVNQFAGFMAGYQAGGWALALAGAAVALWMTFAPSFLFIFAGAPFIARLTEAPRLAGALSAITAAAVGVIANLSLWFALHALFAAHSVVAAGPLRMTLPVPASLNPLAALIAVVAALALIWRGWPLWRVLALSGALALLLPSALPALAVAR